MISKYIRQIFFIVVAFGVFFSLLSNPMVHGLQESWENEFYSSENGNDLCSSPLSSTNKKILAIRQDGEDNTTIDDTNTTESISFVPWLPFFVDENLYYPFAVFFSVLGIFSTLWLIFFVETSKDRTIRERIIGSTIRLVFMSVFLGLAIHYWILFEPF
ncbi:MAG: hypothetical protein ACXAC8_01240 [Candidatus Hodarchaeales archaeon]